MPASTQQQTAADPLNHTAIAIAGTFAGLTHGAIEKRIIALGGVVSRSITASTSVLITTEADYKDKAAKVAKAESRNLPIVSIDWLDQCEHKKAIVPTILFDFTSHRSPAALLMPTTDDAAAAADAPGGRKRDAAAAVQDEPHDESAPKKKRPKKSTCNSNTNRVGPASPDKTEADDDDIGLILKDGAGVDGQIATGRDVVVPVEYSAALPGTKVYICPKTRLIYDAHLVQSNHRRNANKYYRLQVCV